MSANYSNATHDYTYQPTIIEQKLLLKRLAIQIAFLRDEFRRDPRGFANRTAQELLTNPRIILAFLVATVVLAVVMKGTTAKLHTRSASADEPALEIVLYDIGRPGHAGFNYGSGDGSGPIPRRAHGGGGGGDHNPKPPPALPVAGIKIDPALWRDQKLPVYGDPTANATVSSASPGEGGGVGTSRGLGIGAGDGPGVGSGCSGNTGSGYGQNGCCGDGTGGGGGAGGGEGYSVSQVDQRPRVLSKMEPQYTEEARRNQITGTVMLRAVFSSAGEVVQIRALNTLPFGLTERAIAAARQIKFVPAMKGGHPVSVFMQLEYNFNLY